MRISPTLSWYIIRHFLVNFVTIYMALVIIIFLADSVELLRRVAKIPELPISVVFRMALLKLPQDAQELFAFATLFTAMFTFWRLTRTLELVVARAAGISAWEFLWPAVASALVIGVIKITMLNPASSVLASRYERLDTKLLHGHSSALDISSTGLWLRQNQENSYYILHAKTVVQQTGSLTLNGVNLFLFDYPDIYQTRVDAETAHLENGEWVAPDSRVESFNPEKLSAGTFRIATDLTADTIENHYSSPASLSFWVMSRYISDMESTGFSAVKVRMQYDSLLAQPFLLAGIVLVAAAITLGPPRRTNTGMIIGSGTIVAFGLFFLNDVVRALGLEEIIPVTIAAWTPAALTLLIGFAALLFLEDG